MEKACIEEKLSTVQVLQSRLNAAASQSEIDELARRIRLAVGAALQCGSNAGEGAVTCLDDPTSLNLALRTSSSDSDTSNFALRTVDAAPIIPTSAEVTNRVLCVRAGTEAMLQAARRTGDKFGVTCLSLVLSELESSETYLLANASPLTPDPSPSGGFDSPNPALMRRADELAAKAETCVATPQAPGEPPAGLNVELLTQGGDPNATPVVLLKAGVPAPALGGPPMTAFAELPSQANAQDNTTPAPVKIAVASVPAPVVIPVDPNLPPDVLPHIPTPPPFEVVLQQVVKTALDPATPPPSRDETEIAANVIAQNFSAEVAEAKEEAVPVDDTPPDTALWMTPSPVERGSFAFFEFFCDDSVGAVSSDPPSCTFECSLDSASFSSCLSPMTHDSLREGPHAFQVRATDAAGNVDDSPETYKWTIDTKAPDTAISSQPSAFSNQTSAEFAFKSTDLSATFECALDSTTYSACTSPKKYSGLKSESHTFTLRAKDAAGNVSKIVEKPWNSVRIDNTAPETTAKGNKETVFVGDEIAITFSCSEEVKEDEQSCKFECNGANTKYEVCTSPWTIKFTKLPQDSCSVGAA